MLVETRARLPTCLEPLTLLYNHKEHHLSVSIPSAFFVCLKSLTDVFEIQVWVPLMPSVNWWDYYLVLTDGTIA